MNPARLLLMLSTIAAFVSASSGRAVTIDWVTIGDPGNAADTTGYGAVADSFQIMKFEFTNEQYTAFLNSVDPRGVNPFFLHHGWMQSDPPGGIADTGTSDGSRYAVKASMGHKPVNYVSWFDAARVVNWLHNGATGTSSTETGAYTLVSGQTSGTVPARNPGAKFYIPTRNEWYKAAYFNPMLNSGSGGYRLFGNGFDTTPGIVSSDASGNGVVGGSGNFANYNRGADWNSVDGNVTTVGTNGGASYYGAFDMSGNVYEWNDLEGTASAHRGVGGGSWFENADAMSSSGMWSDLPWIETHYTGFRLASPVPSTQVLLHWASGTQTQGAAGYPLLTPVNATSVEKTGAGTVVFDQVNTYTGRTSVNEGTLLVTNSAALQATPITVRSGGTLKVNTAGTMQSPSLTLTGSSQLILPTATRQIVNLSSLSVDQAAGGRIDIGKGRIEIGPGGISEADLRADLIAGRGIGTFAPTNSGIVTSSPSPVSFMAPVIGYNTLPSGAIVVAWSAFGDVNLDGGVDFDDVVQFVAANRYDTGLLAGWADGDFDYNGVVDFDDVVAFTGSRLYDKGSYLPAPLASSAMAAMGGESLGIAAVPEPSTWVMVVGGIACAGWGTRRRRAAA